ncbi:MAG: glycosyltransferase family 39 protein [Anaerolineae bacterium]|nr:glycosyltransferase family 39 protein [Anaerolineae bacterium]
MPLRPWTRWIAVAGLLWLAAILRWIDLPHLPYGLWYDEAYYGLDALQVLEGHLALFFPENNGREPLFIYLVAGAIAILGPTPYALRLTASMIGLLTVAATLRMAWTLSRRWEVGMLSGILMAFLLWPLNLSRVGFRAGLFPLATALILWALTRAARSGRAWDWALAGFLWGGGFYTYLAARMTVLPIALGLILGRWRDPQRFHLRAICLFMLCALLILAPLAAYFLFHPGDFILRGEQTSIFDDQQPLFQTAWEQAGRVGGMFFVRGDDYPRHNTNSRPVFDPLLALAFLIGGVQALKWAPFTVLWGLSMLLPTFLSTEAPHYLRAGGALPVAVFWAALGIWSFVEAAARWIRTPWGRAAILGGCLGLSFPWHTVAYFDPAWWAQARVRGAFSLDSWETAYEIRSFLNLFPDGTVILSERLWAGRAEMRFLLWNQPAVRIRRLDEDPPEPPHAPALVVGWQYEPVPLLRRWLPHEALISLRAPDPWPGENVPRYRALWAEPVDRMRSNLQAVFEDGIVLEGGIAQRSGHRLTVILDWKAIEKPSRDYSVFVHVYPEAEAPQWPPTSPPAAQRDGGIMDGAYNTGLWQPGDRIRETRTVILPKSLSGIPLKVWVGLYRWEDGSRLRIQGGGEAISIPVEEGK